MSNLTAIVIDDEKDLVEVFTEFLEMNNVNVLGVGYDGNDAVELYKKHHPDLVFSDLMMPNYDGIYALENIRKTNPDAKIIIITAFMHSSTAKSLFALRPTRVISKPCDLSTINDIMTQIRKSVVS